MSDTTLYEDPLMTINLAEEPTVKGHLIVKSIREEVRHLEDLQPQELHHLFYGASYSATALFELIGAQGTNIILTEQDHEPLSIHILARTQEDNHNFLWQPQEGNPQEMETVAKTIKDKIDYLLWAKEHPEEAKNAGKPTVQQSSGTIKEKEGVINFLLKSLKRKP